MVQYSYDINKSDIMKSPDSKPTEIFDESAFDLEKGVDMIVTYITPRIAEQSVKTVIKTESTKQEAKVQCSPPIVSRMWNTFYRAALDSFSYF